MEREGKWRGAGLCADGEGGAWGVLPLVVSWFQRLMAPEGNVPHAAGEEGITPAGVMQLRLWVGYVRAGQAAI